VNPASKTALMDVRAARQEQKRLSPAGAAPPFLFLRPVRFLAGGIHKAGNEAGLTEKENKL
jgi:hypothetical protein